MCIRDSSSTDGCLMSHTMTSSIKPVNSLTSANCQVLDPPTSQHASIQSTSTVFHFDAICPSSSSTRDSLTHDVDASPIYSEPFDRLAAGLRQRVAVRTYGCPLASQSPSIGTPPISAGYRLPCDFLDLDTNHCNEHHIAVSYTHLTLPTKRIV